MTALRESVLRTASEALRGLSLPRSCPFYNSPDSVIIDIDFYNPTGCILRG